MDALTVRGKMDKKLAKEQEKLRDLATHDMLAAADKYDNGADCQAKLKPNPHHWGGFPVLAGHRHVV